jgi:hypothetical protein
VHGHDEAKQGKNGTLFLTRCGGCPLKEACKFVVEERLFINDALRSAYRDLTVRGGAHAIWNPKASSVTAPLHNFSCRLSELDLTSVNDAHVAKHYVDVRAKRLAVDRERKRDNRIQLRRAQAAKGLIGPEILKALSDECRIRVERARQRLDLPNPPHWLKAMPSDGPLFLGIVWLVQQILQITGKRAGPTHIAREMQSRFSQFECASSHDVLRKRITRVLPRFSQLERLTMPDGRKIWPEFTADNVFSV